MVFIGACHLPNDCHYISGNVKMKKRMDSLANILKKLGVSPERFKIDYVSSAEGMKFAELVKEMTEQMDDLGKEQIKAENEKIKPIIERMFARKKK
jgi:coenzyme F420-reducing hydrogenase delta subunit